jgi:DNA-binding phage protein
MRSAGRDASRKTGVTHEAQEGTFTRWDAAEHLDNEEEIAAYLQACADEDDPQLMIAALGDVARARHWALRSRPDSRA